MDLASIRIGASEVAAALGVSPYRTPLEWWAEKTGRVDRDDENTATVLGQELEDGIARLFERAHGMQLHRGADTRHPKTEWMAATPDRVIGYEDMTAAFKQAHGVEGGEVVLLEIKTTGLASWKPFATLQEEWGADGTHDIPVHYAAQVQQQIAIVDAAYRDMGLGFCRRAVVKALIPGRGVPEFVVDHDPEVVAWLHAGLERMVHEHLVPEIEPPPECESDWKLREDLHRRTTAHGKRVRKAKPEEVALITAWRHERRELEQTKTRVARLRTLLIEAIGDDWGLETETGKITYSAGKEAPTLRKAAAFDDLVKLLAGAPPVVSALIDDAKKKNTRVRYTGRRLNPRFDDGEDQEEQGADDQ